jgi:mRNA interferase MazF
MTMIHRGDVFLANLNGDGSLQGGTRPVIVISNDMNNKHSPTVHIVPCTTKCKKRYLPVHVYLEHEEIFISPTTALAEQLVPINNTSLLKWIGKISDKTMEAIDKAVRIQLGIEVGEPKSSPSLFFYEEILLLK